MRRTPYLILLAALLTACVPALTQSPVTPAVILVTRAPDATATSTPFQPPRVDPTRLFPAATLTGTVTPTPTGAAAAQTAAPLPATPDQTQAPPAIGGRTQYTFHIVLDYSAHSLIVEELIRYTNRANISLAELTLAVEPNLRPGAFSLNSLVLDGVESSYVLDGHRLQIGLPAPLAPGQSIEVGLQFNLAVPPKYFEDTFGYVGYQMNLTDWYPFVVPYDGLQGWLLHDPWGFGEHLVYESADFEVNLLLVEPDPDLVIAASAPGTADGDWTHYRLQGARTFVLSAGTVFEMQESAVGAVVVRSYYFPGHADAGQAMLWAATQAIGLYEAKFAPYPYEILNVVETEVPDGQEFDGLVFLSSDFYEEYPGKSRSNLVSIGVHEIAHNWWFGLVGNDQALEPWLDEALATYSEHIFYEYTHPGAEEWWWNFRVNYFSPTGWVDTSIYNGGNFRSYTNAAYLNGAYFIHDLRLKAGDQDFFAFLKDYAATYSRRIATGADFFALLQQHTKADISGVIGVYMQGDY
ncbi:MAG: M1 family metallopeptidase [Anaerolineales bacterium]|nr:M1 family metallopeptidase [Anaerolineales bacterium]